MAQRELIFEHTKVLFKNFSGRERRDQNGRIVNREGSRNFNIIIEDEELAEQLLAEGFNIKKAAKGLEEDGEFVYRLQVAVRFDNFPPTVNVVSNNKIQQLKESNVDILDSAKIDYCDIRINAHDYTVNDKSGVKAYLKDGYFVLEVDSLAEKYAAMQSPEE